MLLLAVTAAVLGSSTQFGYNSGVINNPKEVGGHIDVLYTCIRSIHSNVFMQCPVHESIRS